MHINPNASGGNETILDRLHKEISECSKQIKELDPKSKNFEQEKERLIDLRNEKIDQIDMLSLVQDRTNSIRGIPKYNPEVESSTNKRKDDSNIIGSSSSSSQKRQRD